MPLPLVPKKTFPIPEWMGKKNFPKNIESYRRWVPKPAQTKEEARRRKPLIRKVLNFLMYEHMTKAKAGVPGYNAYQIPSKELAERFGVNKNSIVLLAKKWREELGFKGDGHRGGIRAGLKETPREIITRAWRSAAEENRFIDVEKLVEETGKKGIALSIRTIRDYVNRLNKTTKTAPVEIKYGKHLNPYTSFDGVLEFLKKRGIKGARTASKMKI